MNECNPKEDPVVTCPNCGEMDDDDRETLVAWGRGAKVKCSECSHVWSWGF